MLISGTSSGLGKYLFEELGDYSFQRNISKRCKPCEYINTIIHCAWDTKQTEKTSYYYVQNAIDIALELLSIPHNQFIFISSIDVYPKNGKLWTEYDEIDTREICGIYALTKYIVEQLVLERATNPIILRPSILLGKYTTGTMKTLARSITSENIRTSTWSEYNFVRYEDVLEFINYSKDKLTGVFNFTSRKNVKLHELIPMSSPDDKFIYKAGNISNMKAACFVENLNLTSYEIFKKWKKQYYF